MDALPVNSRDDTDASMRTEPTSADVARRANVSRATVSYVLNGVTTQKISDKTREAVRRAAEELGYRPNLAAQSLAAGASRIAMFVVPSVHLGELSIVISSHLTARAAERGVTLVVHFEGPASRAVIDVARDLRPRVVFGMFGLDDETSEWLRERGIAAVSLVEAGGFSMLGEDRSGWLQVEHLVSRGHSRIAFADTTERGLRIMAQSRRRSVEAACAQRDLAAPACAEFALDAHDAKATVRAWADAGVTAVAAYNDEVAVAVLAGIRQAGLRCPDDMAVIGVDEMAINGAMDPPLSSIEFDVDKIALLYADALSDILDGVGAQGRAGEDDQLMRVVERASTARQ